MHVLRLPYPKDSEARRHLLARVRRTVDRHGTIAGTTEEGVFRGSTPFGRFSGSYRSPEGADHVEVVLVEKPWLVGVGMIESEARRFLASG
jgi:hypothetical protein